MYCLKHHAQENYIDTKGMFLMLLIWFPGWEAFIEQYPHIITIKDHAENNIIYQ